jgi:transposase
MRKNELCNLILPLKPKEKIYKIDHNLEKYGHTVVRLPPYMCNLNPKELAWAKIKRIVHESVTGDLSLQK